MDKIEDNNAKNSPNLSRNASTIKENQKVNNNIKKRDYLLLILLILSIILLYVFVIMTKIKILLGLYNNNCSEFLKMIVYCGCIP